VSCHLTNRLRTNHRQRHLSPPTVTIQVHWACGGVDVRILCGRIRPPVLYCIQCPDWLVCNHHLSHFATVLNQRLLKPATRTRASLHPPTAAATGDGACIKLGFIRGKLTWSSRLLRQGRRRDEEMFTPTIALLVLSSDLNGA